MAIEFLKKIILDISIFNFSFWLSIVSKAKTKKKKQRLVGIFLTGASRTEHGPMDGRRTDFLTVKSASFFSPRIKVCRFGLRKGRGIATVRPW
jgi:hypothetical protein